MTRALGRSRIYRVPLVFGWRPMRLSFGDCVFDSDTREVFRAGRSVPISPKAFALLDFLIERRPKAVSKAEIHGRLWPDTFVSEANLANLVVELRAALGDGARKPLIIRTVARFGYAFSATAVPERRRDTGAREAGGGLVYRLVWGRREIALDAGDNLIGRDREAVVWIDDESVSRRHARISIRDEGAIIEDLESKNGTYVDKPTPTEISAAEKEANCMVRPSKQSRDLLAVVDQTMADRRKGAGAICETTGK